MTTINPCRMFFALTTLILNLLPSVLTGAYALPDDGNIALELGTNHLDLEQMFTDLLHQDNGFLDHYAQSALHMYDSSIYTHPGIQGESAPQRDETFTEPDTGTQAGLRRESELALKRRQHLLETLKAKVVYYHEEMQNGTYKIRQHKVFAEDIINLMHHGNDIRRCGKGFRCVGTIVPKCKPKKHVALAMFDALTGHGDTRFDIAFSLTTQGYREESYDFFSTLETALIVADLHPRSTKIIGQGGVDIAPTLKTLWGEIRKLPEPSLRHHLSKQSKYHALIMYQLYNLQKEGILPTLESMKESLAQSGVTCIQKHDSIQNLAYKILLEQKNTPIHIEELFREVRRSDQSTSSIGMPVSRFRSKVLNLTFEGIPIIYNREKSTVSIAAPEPEEGTPPAGTNFLTLVYDCSCKKNQGLSVHEIAYYAHTMGYWRVNNKVKKRRLFDAILETKRFLAILGFISPKNYGRVYLRTIQPQSQLWAKIQEQGADTPEEFDLLTQAIQFTDQPEYTVLLEHINTQNSKKPPLLTEEEGIISLLSKGCLAEDVLFRACKTIGITQKPKFWEILQGLTEREGPGRVIFDFSKNGFIWDATSCFEAQETVNIQSDILCVRKRCATFSSEMTTFIMRQRGFKNTHKQTVEHILTGLRVLGLWGKEDERDLSLQRRLFNATLEGNVKEDPQLAADKKIWRRGSVERMSSWVQSNVMEQLWQTYIEELKQTQESPPPQKQQILDREPTCPEQIISKEIPKLKEIFIQKGLWPTDLLKL